MKTISRTDRLGRALAGSQLQIQLYVNRRCAELNHAIQHAIWSEDRIEPTFTWVSPHEGHNFIELQDLAFLTALRLEHLREQLAAFWPRRGPVWDALAMSHTSRESHVILVEAKSYVRELYGGGTRASSVSLARIRDALSRTQQWLGVSTNIDWTGRLYQYANRLAHVYFFREIVGLNAWLVNVHFVNDPHSPTNLEQWQTGLSEAKRELGFSRGSIPFCCDVFLPARDRAELLSA